MEYKVVLGDITKLKVDAIVNAANRSLLGGGGVDGAIHHAAGPKLLEECRGLHGCKTGEAKITKGYNLPAKYVIHTVGPVYDDYSEDEANSLLRLCYINSLNVAINNGIQTIAFPSISTGVYGFPKESAAMRAFEAVSMWFNCNFDPRSYDMVVTFVCFDKDTFDIYNEMLSSRGLLH